MNPRRAIFEALKEAGFWFVRKGKHEIWTNGKWNVTVPTGSTISERTLKAALQHIEGRGPFYAKQQANKSSKSPSGTDSESSVQGPQKART